MASRTTPSTLAALRPGDAFITPGLSNDVMRLRTVTPLPAGRVDTEVLNLRSLRVVGGPMAGDTPVEIVSELPLSVDVVDEAGGFRGSITVEVAMMGPTSCSYRRTLVDADGTILADSSSVGVSSPRIDLRAALIAVVLSDEHRGLGLLETNCEGQPLPASALWAKQNVTSLTRLKLRLQAERRSGPVADVGFTSY